MDNTLTYMDQGSFLGLRALGRQPLIVVTWIYERPVDVEGLRQFQRNLGKGLIGRRIERSALPFGRHHWVRSPGPDLQVATGLRPRNEAWAWVDEFVCLPIDPEHGPQWRIGVQPLIGGGAVVTLVVSHSVADGRVVCSALASAAEGRTVDLGYPPPGARTWVQALTQDLSRCARSVPDMGKALIAAVRVARNAKDDISSSIKMASNQRGGGNGQQLVAPSITAWIDASQWDERAKDLGGTSNTLFAGLGSRLALRFDRLDAAGKAFLTWPVSDRADGDISANAMTSADVIVDPAKVTSSLSEVRADIKGTLVARANEPLDLLAPLALVPITPKIVARRLEMMALKTGSPTGCSNLGDLDPAANRPDGTEADYMSIRLSEPQVTDRILDRMGGLLFTGCGRVHGQVVIVVTGWRPGGPNSKADLADVLRQGLRDMKLSGHLE